MHRLYKHTAPEVINRKPYDQKVDMWSIGVTTYLLLSGDTPFNGKNRQQLFRRISCDEPTFPDDKWGHISDEAVDFVRKLLTKDPAKRLSATQALSHRWIVESSNMMAQQHPSQAIPNHSGGESSEEYSDRRLRGSSRGSAGRSSPSKPSASSHHSNDNVVPALTRERNVGNHRSKSRDRSVKNRSVSRDRVKNRSVSRDSRDRVSNRSVSRERTSVNRSLPPPPKPQAPARDGSSGTAVKQTMNSSAQSAADENARLLDVIKNQDAKIEKLERMVKRMLEPEGAVHEC